MDATELDLDRELSLAAMRGAYQAATTNNSIVVTLECTSTVAQTLDYYPYGATRISSATGGNEKHQFIGQYEDAATGMSYLNARYYEGVRGQFLSQDPVFWEIGQTRDGKMVLLNPQAQNSYSYGNGNPIVNKDPSGRAGADIAIDLLSDYGPAIDSAFTSMVMRGVSAVMGATTGVLLAKNSTIAGRTDMQASTLATQNSNRRDPEPNPNWFGVSALVGGSLYVIDWLGNKANGFADGFSNADVINVLYQYQKNKGKDPRNTNGNNSDPAPTSAGTSKTYMYSGSAQISAPSRGPTTPSPSSSGYGSAGSTFTNYIAPDTHTACGKLCH